MRRELGRMRPVAGLAAATATVAVTLSGCGGSGSSTAQAGASATRSASGSALRPAPGSSPGDSLALSHMRVLTRLKRAQLCGVVSTAQAGRILGAPAAAAIYASRPGLGILCQWIKRGTAADELYVGISAVIDWSGAQQIDQKLLHARSVTVDGHPALAARPKGRVTWAQVDVALGGAHDPVAEYRAPTLAGALTLAKRATPLIIARG